MDIWTVDSHLLFIHLIDFQRKWLLQIIFFEPVKESHAGKHENGDDDPIMLEGLIEQLHDRQPVKSGALPYFAPSVVSIA